MRHKKSSIHLQTLNHKRISLQTGQMPQQLLAFVDTNQLPTYIQQKMDSVNCTDQNLIKVSISPHGYVVSFYIAFLKLLFVQKPAFEKSVSKLLQILDDDKFSIQMVNDKSSFLYLDWSNSKMKRMISEYFKESMVEPYQSVNQILQQNPDFSKILFLVCWSLMYDSKKVQKFQEFIDFETVKEVLFDYFQIEAYQNQDTILIPDSSILIECVEDSDLYIINLPSFESELENDTSKSIDIKYDMGGLDMASALKLTLDSKIFIEDEEKNLVKTMNFRDMTNRTDNVRQNMQKTLRFRQIRFNTQQQPSSMAVRGEFMKELNESKESNKKHYFKTQGDEQISNSKQQNSKFRIDRLFQMTSHKTTTQKSIYDETPISDSDEYSILDISIPTSKKINQRSITKVNQIQDMKESLKPQNESLIGKWYEFCKIKKNKPENIQSKISKLSKKVENKSHFQQTTQKPDFRKVKSRRRKSQDFDQQNYPSQNPNSSDYKRQVSESTNFQQRVKQQWKQRKPKERQYILHNPKGASKGDNIYSKYGYVNMNISQEFTDSVILKELQTNNESKIKAIKEKARKKRKSIKTLVEKSEKPQIIKL